MGTPFEVDGLVGERIGAGPLLALVLHGGPGLTDYTEPLAAEVLAGGDRTLSVVRYQQRGQAPSSLDAEYTVSEQVRDALAVIDHFGKDQAILVGHSWGAHLAFHIAVDSPDRVLALMAVDALAPIEDGGMSTMESVMLSRIGDTGIRALAQLTVDPPDDPEEAETQKLRLMWPGYFADPVAAPAMPDWLRCDPVFTTLFDDAQRLLDRGFLAKRLPKMTTPTLHVICGDSPINSEVNEAAAALMPDAAVRRLDCGHFPWIESPGAVEAATRQLLGMI